MLKFNSVRPIDESIVYLYNDDIFVGYLRKLPLCYKIYLWEEMLLDHKLVEIIYFDDTKNVQLGLLKQLPRRRLSLPNF